MRVDLKGAKKTGRELTARAIDDAHAGCAGAKWRRSGLGPAVPAACFKKRSETTATCRTACCLEQGRQDEGAIPIRSRLATKWYDSWYCPQRSRSAQLYSREGCTKRTRGAWGGALSGESQRPPYITCSFPWNDPSRPKCCSSVLSTTSFEPSRIHGTTQSVLLAHSTNDLTIRDFVRHQPSSNHFRPKSRFLAMLLCL